MYFFLDFSFWFLDIKHQWTIFIKSQETEFPVVPALFIKQFPFQSLVPIDISFALFCFFEAGSLYVAVLELTL